MEYQDVCTSEVWGSDGAILCLGYGGSLNAFWSKPTEPFIYTRELFCIQIMPKEIYYQKENTEVTQLMWSCHSRNQ